MRKTLEFKKFSVDLCNDWIAVFNPKQYNWVDFNLFLMRLEADRMHGCFEVELYFLGFGIRLYWTYGEDQLEEKLKEYQEIIDRDGWKEL